MISLVYLFSGTVNTYYYTLDSDTIFFSFIFFSSLTHLMAPERPLLAPCILDMASETPIMVLAILYMALETLVMALSIL